jgi:hypothetical protein
MYWCLGGRNLVGLLVTLILIALALISLFTIIDQRLGLIISVVYWSLSLLIVRLFHV